MGKTIYIFLYPVIFCTQKFFTVQAIYIQTCDYSTPMCTFHRSINHFIIELLLVGRKKNHAGFMWDKHRFNFTDSHYKSLASSIDLWPWVLQSRRQISPMWDQ